MTWQAHAACRHMGPDPFYPEKNNSNTRVARLTCAACPVRIQCLNHAIDTGEKHGIWGGYSVKERRRLRRQRAEGVLVADPVVNTNPLAGRRLRGPRRAAAECGTYAGYKRHLRRGETVCEPCRLANNQARQAWLTAQRRRETA